MGRMSHSDLVNKFFLAALLLNVLTYLPVNGQGIGGGSGGRPGQQRPGQSQLSPVILNQYPVYPADQYVQAPFIYNPLPNPFYAASYPAPVQLSPQAPQSPSLSSINENPNQQSGQQGGFGNEAQLRSATWNYPVYPSTGMLMPQMQLHHFDPFSVPITNLFKHQDDLQYYRKKLNPQPKLNVPLVEPAFPIEAPDVKTVGYDHSNSFEGINQQNVVDKDATLEKEYVKGLYSYYNKKNKHISQ